MTIPDGWKLVPLEPTDDMVANIRRRQLADRAAWGVEPLMDDKWAYRAMIAAAPKPPEDDPEEMRVYRKALEEIIAESDDSEAVRIAHDAITPYTPWVAVECDELHAQSTHMEKP